jgi:hypothetical protein
MVESARLAAPPSIGTAVNRKNVMAITAWRGGGRLDHAVGGLGQQPTDMVQKPKGIP